jgi:hypothetical protein
MWLTMVGITLLAAIGFSVFAFALQWFQKADGGNEYRLNDDDPNEVESRRMRGSSQQSAGEATRRTPATTSPT